MERTSEVDTTLALHLNLSLTLLKLEQYAESAEHASQALALQPENPKALSRTALRGRRLRQG